MWTSQSYLRQKCHGFLICITKKSKKSLWQLLRNFAPGFSKGCVPIRQSGYYAQKQENYFPGGRVVQGNIALRSSFVAFCRDLCVDDPILLDVLSQIYYSDWQIEAWLYGEPPGLINMHKYSSAGITAHHRLQAISTQNRNGTNLNFIPILNFQGNTNHFSEHSR